MNTKPTIQSAPAKRERDLRLDFFRGFAMFIILLAHTPGNTWTLWIPARFGFSDATEIFVFCSGMASGIAFGSVFLQKSWLLGASRIAFRVWQVYWAHIGVVIATAFLLASLDTTGLGTPGKVYADWYPVNGLFNKTHEALVGFMTLSMVPGLLDILPMYLVILAMVPVVMAIYKAGGKEAVFAFIVVTWLAANLSGYARNFDDVENPSALQTMLASIGDHLLWMNLPASPFNERPTWFFNPFAWQLVFFTGFCFAMGWIPAPPVNKTLVIAAIAVILLTLPLAWHKIFQWKTGYLPEDWGGGFFWDTRSYLYPVWWKTWIGGARFLHFLALAYLAWSAVGSGGAKLRDGWNVIERSARTRNVIRLVAGAALVLTFPYNYISEIKALAPALDRWFFESIPLIEGRYIGLTHLIHLAAFIVFIWHSIGDRARTWLVQDAFLATVPVIRKVGTQSLAVFMVSIVLSRFNGWWMDSMGVWIEAQGFTYLEARDVWVRLLVNGTGFAVLIATAYSVSWFKSQPWREPRRRAADTSSQSPATGTQRPVAAE